MHEGSCHRSCGPSDFYPGGKCDINGCYYESKNNNMQKEIISQRIIIDEVIYKLNLARDLNKKIEDPEFTTDIFCLIGQHRHTFEDQNITDHNLCISFSLVNGSYPGITGGMMFLAMEDPITRKMIREVYKFINKKFPNEIN